MLSKLIEESFIINEASRFDKEIKKKLSQNNYEGARELYQRTNAVRQHAIKSYNNKYNDTLVDQQGKHNGALTASKFANDQNQSEIFNDLKKSNRFLDNYWKNNAENLTTRDVIKHNISNKKNYGTPLSNSDKKIEDKNNFIGFHQGPYYQLDHAMNRKNKYILNNLASNSNGSDNTKKLYVGGTKILNDEEFKEYGSDWKPSLSNEYSLRNSYKYGDDPGVLRVQGSPNDLIFYNDRFEKGYNDKVRRTGDMELYFPNVVNKSNNEIKKVRDINNYNQYADDSIEYNYNKNPDDLIRPEHRKTKYDDRYGWG